MYSWNEDTSDWYGSGTYAYKGGDREARKRAAEKAAASGPRSYDRRGGPNEKVIDPRQKISTESKNPLIVGIDVTGSMSQWPFEIFDRLPLLYNTLAQYRPDLEVCFAAIGDAGCDRWPLQVTPFAGGYDLEQLLGSLYGEGGGGDAPESYGLFAHWVNTHVTIPEKLEEKPFLIVYGDITMHTKVPRQQIQGVLGQQANRDVDAMSAWRKACESWNVWFMRRAVGSKGDSIEKQWGQAIGEQKIFRIDDEQRAVDYAMGLIARAWGRFGDFQDNMRARQSEDKVESLSEPIEMVCPRCGGPVPVKAVGMFSCRYCGTTLRL